MGDVFRSLVEMGISKTREFYFDVGASDGLFAYLILNSLFFKFSNIFLNVGNLIKYLFIASVAGRNSVESPIDIVTNVNNENREVKDSPWLVRR